MKETLNNRRLTPRTPEDNRLLAAIRKGAAYLRANPEVSGADAAAVVVENAK